MPLSSFLILCMVLAVRLSLAPSVKRRLRQLKGCLAGLCWIAVAAAPGVAAERVVFKVGPLRQAIELSDLETYVETGVAPESLRLYERFLSPQVLSSLQQTLNLDPRLSDRVVGDVLNTPNGEMLLDTLTRVAPNLTIEQLQGAIRLAAVQADGLSVLGILQAIPQETLEVDLSAALGLISQLNLSNLESRSLSGVLEQELKVALSPPLPSDIAPAEPGVSGVSQETLRLRDLERDRIIPVEVYRSRDTHGPLVVLSHGFGADRYFLDYLARHLASYGFTVASVEHPGSNVQALLSLPVDPEVIETPSRLLPASEFLDRPRDVSFVLDRLAQLNRNHPTLAGAFNTDDVVLIGHSLGGYTGLALAGAQLDVRSLQRFCQNIQPLGVSPADWLQCAAVDLPEQTADLSDRRIRQVMAMNPLVGQLFGSAGLSNVQVPTLILTGTQDSVTPTLDQQLVPFDQLAGQKYLLAVIGGTHLSVGDPDNVNPALSELPFMAELRGEDTANLRKLLKGLALSFVQQQTPEAERYRPFLSAAYAESFSTEMLPLRLVESLPASLRSWLRMTTRLSTSVQPRLSERLLALSYLEMIKSRQQWQTAIALHTQMTQVVTLLRPLPFMLGQ